jgi:surface polysaccharide O-acyltransferase-like enzyme
MKKSIFSFVVGCLVGFFIFYSIYAPNKSLSQHDTTYSTLLGRHFVSATYYFDKNLGAIGWNSNIDSSREKTLVMISEKILGKYTIYEFNDDHLETVYGCTLRAEMTSLE